MEVEQLRRDLEEHRRQTAVAITRLEGEQSGHEKVCAERYSGLIQANKDVKDGLNSLTAAIAGRAKEDGERRWEGGWRLWSIVASVAGLFLVAMGWMAAQLFHDAITQPQQPPGAYAPPQGGTHADR